METFSALSVLIFIGLFAASSAAFVGLWCLVCSILSRISGWSSLAHLYRASQPPLGSGCYFQTGWIGKVSYKNCVSIYASPEGFYLAVFPLFSFAHPPLWIPWSTVHHITSQKFLWTESVSFDIGSPKITSLTLPKKAFASLPAMAEEIGP